MVRKCNASHPRPVLRLTGLLLFCALLLLPLRPVAQTEEGWTLYSEPYHLPQADRQAFKALPEGVPTAQMGIYGAVLKRVDLDDLDREVYSTQTALYGADQLFYDATADAYYIHPQTLPETVRMDVFYNETTYVQNAAAWAWGYTMDKAVEDFTQVEDRWYFDGLDPGKALHGQLYILYRTPLTLHTITFFDADGVTKLAALDVLESGQIGSLRHGRNLQTIVPQAMAARYDGWLSPDGEPVPLPLHVTRPMRWIARYKPLHAVTFYADERMDVPMLTLDVIEGEAIDWTAVPAPTLEGMTFTGWQAVAPDTGNPIAMPPADAPVTQPQAYAAQWKRMHTVVFLDGYGDVFHTLTLADGTHIDLSAIGQPRKENLTFSHWVNEEGRYFATNTAIHESMQIVPAFAATVRFMDGALEHARRTVIAGEYLWDVPDAPLADAGYIFMDWGVRFAEQPILEDTVVHALYDVEVTYCFGLMGEYTQIEQLPMGSLLAPPDASLPGYTYEWTPAVAGLPVEGPLVLRAVYTPIPYTVRFMVTGPDGQDRLYHEQSVPHGATPFFPPNPALAGHFFLGWDWPGPESDGLVYGDLVIRALFEALPPDDVPPEALPTEAPADLPDGAGASADWTGDMEGLWADAGAAWPDAGVDPAGQAYLDSLHTQYYLLPGDLPMHGIVSGTVAECME